MASVYEALFEGRGNRLRREAEQRDAIARQAAAQKAATDEAIRLQNIKDTEDQMLLAKKIAAENPNIDPAEAQRQAALRQADIKFNPGISTATIAEGNRQEALGGMSKRGELGNAQTTAQIAGFGAQAAQSRNIQAGAEAVAPMVGETEMAKHGADRAEANARSSAANANRLTEANAIIARNRAQEAASNVLAERSKGQMPFALQSAGEGERAALNQAMNLSDRAIAERPYIPTTAQRENELGGVNLGLARAQLGELTNTNRANALGSEYLAREAEANFRRMNPGIRYDPKTLDALRVRQRLLQNTTAAPTADTSGIIERGNLYD